MLRIQRSLKGRVVFTLAGRMEVEHLIELQRLLGLEDAHSGIALDLNDVTLIDRDAMKFLLRCEAANIGLENCPHYIRELVDREKKRRDEETQARLSTTGNGG